MTGLLSYVAAGSWAILGRGSVRRLVKVLDPHRSTYGKQIGRAYNVQTLVGTAPVGEGEACGVYATELRSVTEEAAQLIRERLREASEALYVAACLGASLACTNLCRHGRSAPGGFFKDTGKPVEHAHECHVAHGALLGILDNLDEAVAARLATEAERAEEQARMEMGVLP